MNDTTATADSQPSETASSSPPPTSPGGGLFAGLTMASPSSSTPIASPSRPGTTPTTATATATTEMPEDELEKTPIVSNRQQQPQQQQQPPPPLHASQREELSLPLESTAEEEEEEEHGAVLVDRHPTTAESLTTATTATTTVTTTMETTEQPKATTKTTRTGNENPPDEDETQPTSTYSSFFSGWWGGSTNSTTTTSSSEGKPAEPPRPPAAADDDGPVIPEEEERAMTQNVPNVGSQESGEDSEIGIDAAPSDEAMAWEQPPPPPPPPPIMRNHEAGETTAAAGEGDTQSPNDDDDNDNDEEEDEAIPHTSRRKYMDETDQRALDDAFLSSSAAEGEEDTLRSNTTQQQQQQPPPPQQEDDDAPPPPADDPEETASEVTVPISNVHRSSGEEPEPSEGDLEGEEDEDMTKRGEGETQVQEEPETVPTASRDPTSSPNRTTMTTTTTTTTTTTPNTTATTAVPVVRDPTGPKIRGLGQVHPETPIHNADVCLRVLRKFARKTRPRIPTTYGGTKSLGIYGYFFAKKQDPTFVPYQILMDILYETAPSYDNDHFNAMEQHQPQQADHTSTTTTTTHDDDESESEHIVQGILGEPGDTMDRARRALAAFVLVFSSWSHASAHEYAASERSKDAKTRESFNDLLAAVLNCASTLIAHGCLDHVLLVIGGNEYGSSAAATAVEAWPVTHLLTQSVLAADLNPERNELAAMKFVLSAGCRTVRPRSTTTVSLSPKATATATTTTTVSNTDAAVSTDALLGGSHLLQTVRMLYHIFLTTESTANKITARAALQQLITHVFARMVQADRVRLRTNSSSSSQQQQPQQDDDEEEEQQPQSMCMTTDGFPSEHHRNAFLILRAICKLSMRSLPDAASGIQAHIGFQASGSNDTWDGHQSGGDSQHNHHAHPAFHSSDAVLSSASSHSTSRADAHYTTPHAQLIYTAAIHPALESKILALDLIHHVLTHTDFPPGFVQRSGGQFQSCLRNYLCVSLLKNCTSSETSVVNWSLRIFVPTVRNFRTVLKTEIEAFVTNVFFVILDSHHSTADHKGIVVRTFDEICSDPVTLAEIFLNYDCDLSAVDLFHRIVQTLSRVSRTGLLVSESSVHNGHYGGGHGGGGGGKGGSSSSSSAATLSSISSFVLGSSSSSAARMEKIRFETRELRLDAMKALRQVLASLHASIVEPMAATTATTTPAKKPLATSSLDPTAPSPSQEGGHGGNNNTSNYNDPETTTTTMQNPVEVYGSKKKRRAEEAEAMLRFNQKPSAGLAYAAQCGHLKGDDPVEVAKYLCKLKDAGLDKTMIGEFLGREAEYQNGFSLRVLHEYVRLLDFTGLVFDEAIRYFLSGFRLPGEAQKIDRIMEKFAERFTEQNPGQFPTPDVAFILSFSIIMLNTDLHNPAIKEERRMTKEGFVRNNRGICDGQDLPPEFLTAIFDRIKENPISLKEDDEARERAGESKHSSNRSTLQAAMNPASFFSSHYDEMDRARENNFRKERDHIVRTTESLLKRRRHHHDGPTGTTGKTPKSKSRASNNNVNRSVLQQQHQRFVRTEDSGLRDEYVAPMFEVAWGPALAAFSTAMESANGTMGSLLAIATDEELEIAAENAAETIEVCLTGFRFAICTGGLCGNEIARDSFMLALSRFTQLGSGTLLEPRHVRCCQTLLSLAREDGELLGTSWEHVFRALSEVNRFHQLFHLMARNDRAAAAAADRRRKRLEERENRRRTREERKRNAQESMELEESASGEEQEQEQQSGDWESASASGDVSDVDSLAESDLFSDSEDYELEEDMDAKAVDEANARLIYEGISEDVIEVIYERSSSLSVPAIKEFVSQLCYVSSMEISVGYGSKDLNHVSYRQQHALLANSSHHGNENQFHHTQPNIYNLQKLVEVAHYNMESRPRLVFADLWSTIANHLTQTALHKNPALAMYAVDSFRQLSIQFLQRDELEAFEFQRRFLKPLETVMAQSNQSSTKELLLNCVARVIQVFDVSIDNKSNTKGGLRSGWVPLLVILGLGGRDDDIHIARMSFDILKGQILKCAENVKQPTTASVLLTEHFPEAVDAVFMCAGGPHLELSVEAIQLCSLLARYLSDQNAETPHTRQRVIGAAEGEKGKSTLPEATQDLELWWPLLLGISRAVGEDERSEEYLLEALDTLFRIINDNFFCAAESEDRVQRIQLVFRGILTPMLEFAEVGSGKRPPQLPKDFERFLSSHSRVTFTATDDDVEFSWLDIMFDRFMDACIALCKRTIDELQTNALVEEVFAILNHCLVSDSGALAVRGVARLEQFVTSDLDPGLVTDGVWATVCHMLSRCLSVRGLPRNSNSGESEVSKEEYEMEVHDFIAEESILPERRYVGSNAVLVIGNILSSERISDAMGFHWNLFLVEGLGKGIAAWEEAASLLAKYRQKDQRNVNTIHSPPDYRENAYYGRKWMNRFLIRLASMEEVVLADDGTDDEVKKMYKAAQNLVVKETENLLLEFVEAELAFSRSATKQNDATYKQMTKLAVELMKGYTNMRHEHIMNMTWLNPILLSSCIQSKNEEVLALVQKFIKSGEPEAEPQQGTQQMTHDDKGEGDIPTDEGHQEGAESSINETLEQEQTGPIERPWDEAQPDAPLAAEAQSMDMGLGQPLATDELGPPPDAPIKPLTTNEHVPPPDAGIKPPLSADI